MLTNSVIAAPSASPRSDDVTATPSPDPAGNTLSFLTRKISKAGSAGCSEVRKVEVRGVVDIDGNDLREKLEPLAVACIGNNEVKAILSAINETYADQGYVATQGYLPEQDLRASKILVINIIAGRIDKVLYRENRGDEALEVGERFSKGWTKIKEAKGPWSFVTSLSQLVDKIDDPLDNFQLLPGDLSAKAKLWNSFITDSGDVVQINAIQQGVDQINRVASSKAQVKLEPGSAPATSTVVVENNGEDSFRVNAGYELNGADINGSGNTIPSRFKLDVAKDNFIGINDAWRLSYAGGLDSNEIRGAFSVPFRRFTLSLDAVYSESLSEVTPGVEMFTQDGTVTAALGYLLYRSRARQITLDNSLAWRNNERFLNGVSLTPQTLPHGRIGITETRTFETLQLSYGIGFDRGLAIASATEDPADIAPSAPRARFVKIDGKASTSKVFETIGMLRIDLNAQWTDHPLYSDDQLVLGSVSSVRGFTNGAVRADRGAIVRTEFAPAFSIANLVEEQKDDWVFAYETLQGLQPYVFADYGAGYDIANREVLERAGIGVGLRYRHGRVNLDASIGEPVHRIGGPKTSNWRAPEAYLTLSVKLL
ncbi:ShlB/FhaC/HecB family hemolysin secretion/activation protein [Microvirga terrae]|uniref:ShlB/FhaC/HecB family hemolysin secretion/activation protein n=1 Tax=Microvirga terrae TaxID=2740529 RepID=A0ABY5RRU4_9HYPH|nr:ShlB/FhaC/HecB family hemolysin secretion/activation protein [Microvirga terrae]UVF19983.1 ShlB/FhaC/HecB family hemolysin secretion/activation protein [Microvirga terrae]